MTPVTLHATTDLGVVGLRLECPHTGQVLTVALPLDQQRELLASLSGSVARGESILADPYAPAVARFEDWKARRAGKQCDDCDDTDTPCTCQIAERPHLAEPLIGRAHGEAEYPMSYVEQLRDALAGR